MNVNEYKLRLSIFTDIYKTDVNFYNIHIQYKKVVDVIGDIVVLLVVKTF